MFLDFLSFAEKIGVLVFSQKCFKFWNLYLIYFDFSSIAVVNWWYYRENEFKKVFPWRNVFKNKIFFGCNLFCYSLAMPKPFFFITLLQVCNWTPNLVFC